MAASFPLSERGLTDGKPREIDRQFLLYKPLVRTR